jgi:hypothetical protein
MRGGWLGVVLAFSSCGGQPEPSRPVPESTAVAPTTAPPASTAPPPPTTTATPSEPPTLVFAATPVTSHVAMSIANHGASETSLAARVIVEVEHDGAFAEVPSTSALALRYDCAHEAEHCVTLAAGAELLPPDWLGTWGDMQCVCTRCGPVEPGNYRLVVTTCDGSHRTTSNTFAMPPPAP